MQSKSRVFRIAYGVLLALLFAEIVQVVLGLPIASNVMLILLATASFMLFNIAVRQIRERSYVANGGRVVTEVEFPVAFWVSVALHIFIGTLLGALPALTYGLKLFDLLKG